ncbi:MAG: hypothetical protein HY429_04445 [Candidatus Levybacteria bacterium]|nr:hypothetical protein [Candidatus Levybacteria bacterium]
MKKILKITQVLLFVVLFGIFSPATFYAQEDLSNLQPFPSSPPPVPTPTLPPVACSLYATESPTRFLFYGKGLRGELRYRLVEEYTTGERFGILYTYDSDTYSSGGSGISVVNTDGQYRTISIELSDVSKVKNILVESFVSYNVIQTACVLSLSQVKNAKEAPEVPIIEPLCNQNKGCVEHIGLCRSGTGANMVYPMAYTEVADCELSYINTYLDCKEDATCIRGLNACEKKVFVVRSIPYSAFEDCISPYIAAANATPTVSPEACRYQDFQIKQDAKRNCATNECENDIIQIYQEYNKNCVKAKTLTDKNEVIDSFIKNINSAQERDRLLTIARNKSEQDTNRDLITYLATDSCADLDNPRPQTLGYEDCVDRIAHCFTLPATTDKVNQCRNEIFSDARRQAVANTNSRPTTSPPARATPAPTTAPAQAETTGFSPEEATPLPTATLRPPRPTTPVTPNPTCDTSESKWAWITAECDATGPGWVHDAYQDCAGGYHYKNIHFQGGVCGHEAEEPTPTPTKVPFTPEISSSPLSGGTRFKLSNYPDFTENEEGDDGSPTQIFNSAEPKTWEWTVSTIAEKPMVWLQYLDQNNNPGDPSYSENLQDGMTLFESATGFKIVLHVKERVTEVLVNGERVNPNSEIVVDLPGEENRAQFFTVEIIWRYNTGREEREFLGFDYIPEFEQQCEPGTPVNDCDNDKGSGHTYCVYDPDGNYEGGCSVEVCSNGGKPPDCEEEPGTNEPEATPEPKPQACPSGCDRAEDGLCWRGPVEKVNDECPEDYRDEDDPNTGCWGICE